ncbi:ATP-binding protein [Dactylosporangium darangshiense]|uniref:LuxR family transcriptional regulator n=1 Tax=Dactylosporangium darangshiense TaxID=579108 RepID=A0ABP8DPG6_9ACTN
MGGGAPVAAGLFGRDRELAELAARVAAAAGGHGDAVVVLGEPGIGKTALLAAVRRDARDRGLLVLSATGVESEAALPFAALHQLLRPVLADAPLLPAVQREALLSAFGLLEARRPEPVLISLAAVNLVARLAQRRAVVVLADDAQWLDPQSHDVLAVLARRAGEAAVAVVAAMRTGYDRPLLAAGLPALRVERVDDEAASAILDRHGGGLSAADRRRVQEEALGNPLALLELPAAIRAEAEAHRPAGGDRPVGLTVRLERAFAGRLADLPSPTRDAVLVAACDSGDTVEEVVAAAAVLARLPLDRQVLAPAVDAGLIVADAVRVEFRHPLVRSGVLQAEPVQRRLAAHAALADVVADAFRRIWHRAQSIAGRDDAVADALEAAAAAAVDRGARASAVQWLERAAQLTVGAGRRGHRLLVAAEHAFGLGRTDDVGRLVRAASQLELGALDVARLEWLREIFSDGTPGDAARVVQLCELAQGPAAGEDADLALNLLLGAALRCWWADTGPAARATVVAAAEALPQLRADPRHLAAVAVAEPVLQCREVLRRLDRVAADHAGAEALRLYGMAAHAVGDETRAADFLAAAETELREQGRLGLLPQVLSMTVQVCLELGDWPRARAAAAEGRRLAEQTGQPVWSTGTIACDARADALRGDVDAALRLATRAELAASPGRLNDILAVVQLARGAMWFSEDRFDDAFAELRRLFDPLDPAFHRRERFAGVMFLAEAAVHAGRAEEALAVVEELEQVAAAQTPSPLLAVHLLYARAVLAADAQAEALYLVGLGADLTRWPWVRARLQLEYGRWLCGHGRARAAAPLLAAALATFEKMEAAAWVRQTRALME